MHPAKLSQSPPGRTQPHDDTATLGAEPPDLAFIAPLQRTTWRECATAIAPRDFLQERCRQSMGLGDHRDAPCTMPLLGKHGIQDQSLGDSVRCPCASLSPAYPLASSSSSSSYSYIRRPA